MSDGNGIQEEKRVHPDKSERVHPEPAERVKKCPFLGEWCIGEACALMTELSRPMGGGLVQKMSVCSLSALVIILGEINLKTPSPQRPKINLPPGLGRG